MNALRGVQEHAVRPIEAESGVESGEVCMTEWEELAAKIRKKQGKSPSRT